MRLALLTGCSILLCSSAWSAPSGRAEPVRPKGPVTISVAQAYLRSLKEFRRWSSAYRPAPDRTLIRALTSSDQIVLDQLASASSAEIETWLDEAVSRDLQAMQPALSKRLRKAPIPTETLEQILLKLRSSGVTSEFFLPYQASTSMKVKVAANAALLVRSDRRAAAWFRKNYWSLPTRSRVLDVTTVLQALHRSKLWGSPAEVERWMIDFGPESRYASRFLADLPDGSGRSVLRKLIINPGCYHGQKVWAIRELARVGDRSAQKAFHAALTQGPPPVYQAAAEAVARIGDRSAIPHLRRALQRPPAKGTNGDGRAKAAVRNALRVLGATS